MIEVDTQDRILTPEFARSAVRRETLRTGSAIVDDDLVGEALLRGVIAFRRTSDVIHPYAFFNKIVRDTVRDYWRRRHESISIESVPELAHVFDFEASFDRARQIDCLHATLMQLPIYEYTLIDQFYFEELSISQISGISGKSASAIKMALLRGRKRIVRALTVKLTAARFRVR
jgi:RNA polymerase sigma factor (sigma-70 family)